MIRRRVIVSGRVQGVGFRAATAHAAAKYSLLGGYVRNLSDGRVEAVFEGEDQAVLKMLEWSQKGSPNSRVSFVEVIEEECRSMAPSPFRVCKDRKDEEP